MKKWNKDDWQGKRKDQVNFANAIATIMWILMLIMIVVGIINRILN